MNIPHKVVFCLMISKSGISKNLWWPRPLTYFKNKYGSLHCNKQSVYLAMNNHSTPYKQYTVLFIYCLYEFKTCLLQPWPSEFYTFKIVTIIFFAQNNLCTKSILPIQLKHSNLYLNAYKVLDHRWIWKLWPQSPDLEN